MKAKIISCNLAKLTTLDYNGKKVRTGIFKEPVDGPILLDTSGARGDHIADLRVHGGARKAVYVYPSEHYAYWAEKLGRDSLPWGTLGENLTIESIGDPVNEDTVHLGDRFRVGVSGGELRLDGAGGALLEVTKPRLPCYKFATKLGTNQVARWMMDRGAFGFYVAVIEPGEVRAGDIMELVSADPGRPTIRAEGVRRSE
jgi:MOSC domain-containing protein YiiM